MKLKALIQQVEYFERVTKDKTPETHKELFDRLALARSQFLKENELLKQRYGIHYPKLIEDKNIKLPIVESL